MANELVIGGLTTGTTVTFVVRRKSDGKAWRTSDSSWQAYAHASIADYKTSMTESSTSGVFLASFPSHASITAGWHTVIYYSGTNTYEAAEDIYWNLTSTLVPLDAATWTATKAGYIDSSISGVSGAASAISPTPYKLFGGTQYKLMRVYISKLSDGSAYTGLTYSSSGLKWYYIREDDAAVVSVTPATMTVGTWATGGFVEIDSTNMPGIYELGVPVAALAAPTASNYGVDMLIYGVSDMRPLWIRIELDQIDYVAGYVTVDGFSSGAETDLAAALAAQANLVVYSAATGSTLDLFRGDSYTTSGGGRGITITKTSSETHWPTTLSTVHFSCTPTAETVEADSDAASLTTIAGYITQATGASQAFRIELTATQLATLTPGIGAYDFWIVANQATYPATLRSGAMTVRADRTW